VVKRHIIKLAILIPALVFLFWWGWSGNFAFNSGSLFTLLDGETFYDMELGVRRIGQARREVRNDYDGDRLSVFEESAFSIPAGSGAISVLTHSETVFDRDGRLLSADFSIPLGFSQAEAKAVVSGGRLSCVISLGDLSREAEVTIPPNGPILVSGLVPWLARQRDIPLGRPLGLELLDPVSMTFRPADLVIEDATEAADELEIYRLTLRFMDSETVELINSEGRRLEERNPAMDLRFTYIASEVSARAAAESLKKAQESPDPLPEGAGSRLVSFLAGSGLELLEQTLAGAPGLEGSPWIRNATSAPEGAAESGSGASGGTAGRTGTAAPDSVVGGSASPDPAADSGAGSGSGSVTDSGSGSE
jgi:hypothetical protein